MDHYLIDLFRDHPQLILPRVLKVQKVHERELFQSQYMNAPVTTNTANNNSRLQITRVPAIPISN